MEFFRRLLGQQSELAQPASLQPETPEQEIHRWNEAFLGESIAGIGLYAATLTLGSDPRTRCFAYLNADLTWPYIDIPLIDHTPKHTLIQKAQKALLSEMDPEKYRDFATGNYLDPILAMLNREEAGILPNEAFDWFFNTFGIGFCEKYGSIYTGSHGGQNKFGFSFHATLNSGSRATVNEVLEVMHAIKFAQTAQMSLPHVHVNPLSVDAYLAMVNSSLKSPSLVGQ